MDPVFLEKRSLPGGTYEIYQSTDTESAKAFLKTRTVTEPKYYVIIETPDGNWGIDKEGLYLEQLLPWQKDLSLAGVEGSHNPLSVVAFSLQMAARHITDNFIVQVTCGSCGQEWLDGVRYQNTTVVRCPKCKTYNSIDTGNIQVFLT
jgi:phage FluMu protein Com